MYFVLSVLIFCWGMHIQSSDITVTRRIPSGLAATAHWIQKQLPSKLYINPTRISVRNPELLRNLDGMQSWLSVKARFCHLPVDSCSESLNLDIQTMINKRIDLWPCGQPSLLSNGTGSSFPGEGKASGAWSWPLTSILCRSQEKWRYTSTPTCVFVV
jgi:hypothetical protein